MGIPLIVHYCWFGNEIPEKVLKVIDSWREHLPDYQFYLWGNEHLNDYNIKFLKQAQNKRAYAFVADYFRLRKVYEYGGFYLDTDMMLLKPLDSLLSVDFVICSETDDRPAWGFFGSKKNNYYLRECFEKYHTMEYDQFKPPVIPYFLKDITISYINQEPQSRLNLDPEYFYPIPVEKCNLNYMSFVTEKTIGVHLWDFSWLEIKLERSKKDELLYRIKVLMKDLTSFMYSPYYFRINLIRILRLIRR
jgi:mannosyltransferase OCH1-like enzyme